MIPLLRGTVAFREEDQVVIDVNGVGYQVAVPTNLVNTIPSNEEVTLHISTVIREDAFLLFGFVDPMERTAFNTLRQINGIGPKLALAILSQLSIDSLAKAVAEDNTAAISTVKGVGKRTASRMCLELKEKLPVHFVPTALGGRPAAPDPLILALAQLDYKKSEIDRALSATDVVAPNMAPLETRLSAALRVLARL